MNSQKEFKILVISIWCLMLSCQFVSCQKRMVTKNINVAVKVDTLKINSKNSSNAIVLLNFPLIKTGKKDIDDKINTDMINKYTDDEYSHLSSKEALNEMTKDGFESMDFLISYNQNGLISFYITAEACGAYCSSWTTYYTYSVLNGEYQSIDKIIRLTPEFKSKIVSDFSLLYREELLKLDAMYKDRANEIDEETYSEVLGIYEACKNDFEMEDFVLYPDHLEIIDQCEVRHAINNFGLNLSVDYKYKSIKENLLFNLEL